MNKKITEEIDFYTGNDSLTIYCFDDNDIVMILRNENCKTIYRINIDEARKMVMIINKHIKIIEEKK